ncbi:MAG: DUF4401 domain-containing protein [Pseudomonadota bacterium]
MNLPASPAAESLWSRLRAAGAVSGDTPAHRDGLPWYLAGLIGVSAWIAAGLLFGFFATLFDELWKTPGIAVTAGALCIAAALGLLRIARGGRLNGRSNSEFVGEFIREFIEQSAIALSLVGQLLVGVGFNEWFGNTAGWAGSAAIALALYGFGAQTMHRFLCGAIFTVAVVAICNELDTASYGVSPVGLPALAWLAFAAWWRAEFEGIDHRGRRALPLSPLAWALSLAALLMVFFGEMEWDMGQGATTWRTWGPRIAVALLLPLTVWRLAGVRQLLPVLCAMAFALIWLRAPGVNLGVMLALTAFAAHRPALLATGLLGTGVYLIRYYYQLDVPLLEKSQWLLLGGVALLAIRFALMRIALRAHAGDRP